MAHLRAVRKKQIILYQGEASSQRYVVKSGIVRAYSTLSNYSEVVVAMFGPGDYFPVGSDSNGAAVALFYYEMMYDGELECYSPSEFVSYLENQANEFNHAGRRYLGALLHINALAQVSAYEKLLHTMRYLAMRFGTELHEGIFTRIELKLTQQDIASLSNLSRETTNMELTKLKAANAIVERNKLYSVNLRVINKLIDDNIGQEIVL